MSNQLTMLTILATPIGNISDISTRAIETLSESDFILAEDTREAGKLIQLLELPKKQFISYRDQNHKRVLPEVLDLLAQDKKLTLISDRGTPGISDPGYMLIRDVIAAGHDVQVVPGPTALIAALTLSGLPTDKFTFLGFLPKTKSKQAKLIQKAADLESTFIIYESPYRIVKTIKKIKDTLGEVQVAAISEITKIHEKVLRGAVTEVLSQLEGTKPKGEWVIVAYPGNLKA